MNNKEWNDTKQVTGKQKIEVDLSQYQATDPAITEQRVVNYIDNIIELNVENKTVTLATCDLLMYLLAVGIDPDRYKFFYNKHMLIKNAENNLK